MKKSFKAAVACILASVVLCGCASAGVGAVKPKPFNLSAPTEEFKVAQYNQDSVLKDYPLLVGGHAHGAENIRILKDLGLGNFVWIPKYGYALGNTPWDAENGYAQDIDAALESDFYYMVSHKRGLGDEFKKGGSLSGGDTATIYPNTEEDIAKVVSGGDKFIGWQAEELDADFLQTGLRPAFADRVPEVYNFDTPAQARINYETELQRLQKQAYDMGGNFISNQLVTHQLNAFRAGNDIVMSELLEHGVNTELQLAYMRGGKQQFGNDWGVWISPWYYGTIPTADKALWTNDIAQIGGGHKPSSYKRALYESYVSGARVLTNQETEPLFARDELNDGYKTVLWGTELKNFWNYAKNNQETMKPASSFAIMVDRDNGWEPAHLWQDMNIRDSRWAQLPITDGDRMLSEYLNAFLPGYKRTSEAVQQRKDLYPGYFASTPVGNFDIVATDCDPSRLAQYDTVILLGDISMNDILMNTLQTYVNGGGELVINAYQSMQDHQFYEAPDFYGYSFSRYDGWLASDRVNGAGSIRMNTTMAYMPEEVYSANWFFTVNGVVDGAEIVAYTENGVQKDPAVVKNQFGRGTVYLTLTENMMTGLTEVPEPMSFYMDFLRAVVLDNNSYVKSMPAASDAGGTDDYSWMASYQGDDLVVLLSNHGASDGSVTVTLDDEIAKENISVDVGAYTDFETQNIDGKTVITLRLKTEDITLLRVKIS